MQEHQSSQRQHQFGHTQLAIHFQVISRVMPGAVGLRPNYHTFPMRLKDQVLPTSRVNQTLQPHHPGRLYPPYVLHLRSARLPSLSQYPCHGSWTAAFAETKESSVKLSELQRDRLWTKRSESGQQRHKNPRASRKALPVTRTTPNAVSPSQVPQAVLLRIANDTQRLLQKASLNPCTPMASAMGLVPARRISPTMVSLEEELDVLQTHCCRRVHKAQKCHSRHLLRRHQHLHRTY